MFDSVENKSISQIIIEQIQNMILSGQLKTGDKLPPERQLIEMLKVGRPALREALKSLEVVGLIEKKHGQGNYITSNMESSFYKPLSLAFKLNNGNIEDILDLREVLETFTVRETALRANNEDIQRLYKIHENMIAENDDRKKSEYDRLLHYEIAKISGNKLIVSIMESTSYLMETFFDKTLYISLYEEKSINVIYEEHLKLIQLIEKHDQVAAVEAIQSHLKKINIELLKKLQ
jgi:GntR family transcriptional regulator, transcriptional repressor for pyruvate dehydrogenase complex